MRGPVLEDLTIPSRQPSMLLPIRLPHNLLGGRIVFMEGLFRGADLTLLEPLPVDPGEVDGPASLGHSSGSSSTGLAV